MRTSAALAACAGKRILVAGEAILDEYLQGGVRRLSREAPVPVVDNPTITHRCGGAANAAANIASLGGKPTLVAAVGDDRHGIALKRQCEAAGIHCATIEQQVTNHKQRILGAGQQLLRVDNMAHADGRDTPLVERAISELDEHDAVLLSDYGTGLLARAAELVTAARQRGLPVIVDPRPGDWQRYAGATLVKPSLEEFHPGATLGDADLEAALMQLREAHDLGDLLVTGGRQGLWYLPRDGEPVLLPTHALEAYDVTGAGDTVAAVAALGVAGKLPPRTIAELANQAARVVVGELGAVPVRADQLQDQPNPRAGTVTTLDALPALLEPLRAQGRRVVLTNGCFDIIHAGHLDTLTTAAAHGEVLVVAVNDDASVRGLKGSTRPIIPAAERMELLAGFGCVDYVVPFGEPDATAVVATVKPDVYVKGGDWAGKEPPEAAPTRQHGGQVVFAPTREGRSSTLMIDALRDT